LKTKWRVLHPLKTKWRVGSKVKINVYEGDRPVCQCHNEKDAAEIVMAMNDKQKVREYFSDVLEKAKTLRSSDR